MLIRQGVTHIATFVPWQAVESDISHTLPRFLQALAERKLTVSLILTPEVGVHYPYSGLPKDLFSKAENAARHAEGGTVNVPLPPNAFALPSLTSQEFLKRYHNFLSRIDALLADLAKAQPWLAANVTAVLGGSFWKYYRSPATGGRAFVTEAGDFSGAASVAFRQRIEQHFATREFQEPTPASANRWKSHAMEETNRRWFQQQSEDVFRWRSAQFLKRKAAQLKVAQAELFTPEADPAASYSALLQLLSGGRADFRRISDLVTEYASRAAAVGETRVGPYIHFTKLGGFRTLSDSEKQFLILKSILLMGGQGGGVLIDEAEWSSLSQGFRARAENLARMARHGTLALGTEAYYLAPHLWSGPSTLWDEISSRLPARARWVTSSGMIAHDERAGLVVIDPATVLTRETIERLLAIASRGKIVALPRTRLYTEAAKRALESAMRSKKSIEMSFGVTYRLEPVGHGKLLVYDPPEASGSRGEALASWKTFADSLLSVAGIETPARVSDGRLELLVLDKREGGRAMFILNGTPRGVNADLMFEEAVIVSDLAMGAVLRGARPAPDAHPESAPSSRFGLEVPPFGILPVSVDTIGESASDRRAAAMSSELMKAHALQAARNELPGFDGGSNGMDSVWN